MTLVANGRVVVGTVRTPDAVYTIRTAGDGTYVISQIDESSLPPPGEPLIGSSSAPEAQPPVPQQRTGQIEVLAPTATSTSPPPTPVSTVPSQPSEVDDEAKLGGLFLEVEGDPPPSPDVETLASRLVQIDFGQLARVTESPDDAKDSATGEPSPPQTLMLNLFDDVVFTGIVEHIEPTSSGYALWGRLEGVELGNITLVVNGRVVVGTVRTPKAVYTIRTAGDGHVRHSSDRRVVAAAAGRSAYTANHLHQTPNHLCLSKERFRQRRLLRLLCPRPPLPCRLCRHNLRTWTTMKPSAAACSRRSKAIRRPVPVLKLWLPAWWESTSDSWLASLSRLMTQRAPPRGNLRRLRRLF